MRADETLVLFSRLRRVLHKPPAYVMRRIVLELRHELDRFTVPSRGRSFDVNALLVATQATSLTELWIQLRATPSPYPAGSVDPVRHEALCPGDMSRIEAAAQRALDHQIDLLGSGPVQLGPKIDWHKDYKTGDRWPLGYFRDVDYINKGRPSDVKTVWELSRMQWLIPAGQAYRLTGDNKYALAVREVLEQWIEANPYGCSVNWGVTMEPAMRIFVWTWLFHVFADSESWQDEVFRGRFLVSLYLHGEFTERFIERSDVNGNHLTADVAALIVAGIFFNSSAPGRRWFDTAHAELEREVLLQVFPDGVDFEASVAYHRLVAELFLHASLWATSAGRPFGAEYGQRLRNMGKFAAAYSRPDGTSPLWGDADDARVLPFGGQSIIDHRYLPGIIGLHLTDADLVAASAGSRAEGLWLFGTQAAAVLPERAASLSSQAFRDGGFFIMRNDRDHVFIDCGPIGLAGRGGHGHNDLLAFEAMLDGTLLISDCGSYVYTASFDDRNRFRSTAMHNTPQVDAREINRFVAPDNLWSLHDDATPVLITWESTPILDQILMSHTGYSNLQQSIHPQRRIELDRESHTLTIEDRFTGEGSHQIRVPLQLAFGVNATVLQTGTVRLVAAGREFDVRWLDAHEWDFSICNGRISPSYGVVLEAQQLVWRRSASVDAPLVITISPGAKSHETFHIGVQ